MEETAVPAGLFAGLCVLDIIQLVDHVPRPDEKSTALRQTVAAGGPATNAAVTFAHLGGGATLVTGVGAHPLAAGIRAELRETRVRLIDLAEGHGGPPAVSSIMVTAGSGERAVVSMNAEGYDLDPPADLAALVSRSSVVQVDGHHPRLAEASVLTARRLGRTTLLDGGSWKPGTPALLPHTDVAVCSSDFHPPGASTPQEVLRFLRSAGVPWAAVTRGGEDILWQGPDGPSQTVPVPQVAIADTLGAGDVFHGALAFELAQGRKPDFAGFPRALRRAAAVAAGACGSFGTRSWMGGDDQVTKEGGGTG
ncbi:PfkB family carbohydrate kinase [Actinomadura scrupuli]|uniref:PfkB family carbohydrate kinase n=1 Tax=Actinomadura scrupuli TaxID=559629 RepID=UPI003D9918D9